MSLTPSARFFALWLDPFLDLEVGLGVLKPMDDPLDNGFALREQELVVARGDGPEVRAEEKEHQKKSPHSFPIHPFGFMG